MSAILHLCWNFCLWREGRGAALTHNRMDTSDFVLLVVVVVLVLLSLVPGIVLSVRRSRAERAWLARWEAAGDSAAKRELMKVRPERNDFQDALDEIFCWEEVKDLEDQERLGVDRQGLPFARRAEEARALNIVVREDDTVETLLAKLRLLRQLAKHPGILQDMPKNLSGSVNSN